MAPHMPPQLDLTRVTGGFRKLGFLQTVSQTNRWNKDRTGTLTLDLWSHHYVKRIRL